jgi:hypothetical protein
VWFVIGPLGTRCRTPFRCGDVAPRRVTHRLPVLPHRLRIVRELKEHRDGPILPVERLETHVMFLEVHDQPVEIRRAWEQLEEILGSLRGRKFLGTFDGTTGTYRACVQLRVGDDPDALGLRTAQVPGGPYLRARLRGEPPELYERIPSAFADLEAAATRDHGRPGIELYRRRDEVDLLLPLAVD